MTNRLCALAVGALALTACGKSDDATGTKKTPAASTTIHKGDGKGTGSAAKTGTGSGTGSAVDPKAALVARGEYLATSVGGCVTCHTPQVAGGTAPDTSMLFGGGLTVPDVRGTWDSSNITSDPDTGIGNWTDEQVIAAIRQGIRPDGTALNPIMPYAFYNKMTDEDAKAIVAYLRTTKPVVNAIVLPKSLPRPEHGLPPPTGNTDPTDDPVKHGEYLAALMNCAACHTPMIGEGKNMRPDPAKTFAGGLKFEFPAEAHLGTGPQYSANLTSDPATGLSKYTEEDIIRAVRMFTRPDGTPIRGPMAMYAAEWVKVTDADVAALAKYIKQLPPIVNKVPPSNYKPYVEPAPAPGQ